MRTPFLTHQLTSEWRERARNSSLQSKGREVKQQDLSYLQDFSLAILWNRTQFFRLWRRIRILSRQRQQTSSKPARPEAENQRGCYYGK